MARIEGIFTTPHAGGEMESHDAATLVTGVGIQGDRYAAGVGTYSVLRGSQQHGPHVPEPGRQVTLLSADEVDAAAAVPQHYPYGNLRRNLVVRGLPVSTLDTVGQVLQIVLPDHDDHQSVDESILLFVHRHCVPCIYNEKKNGIPGLRDRLWEASGVNCQVLRGGSIRVGSVVRVLTVQQAPAVLGHAEMIPATADPGYKPPGFFLRPSQKTAAMVRQGLDLRKRAYAKYAVSDPAGVARAQAAFASVGLSFWPASCLVDTGE